MSQTIEAYVGTPFPVVFQASQEHIRETVIRSSKDCLVPASRSVLAFTTKSVLEPTYSSNDIKRTYFPKSLQGNGGAVSQVGVPIYVKYVMRRSLIVLEHRDRGTRFGFTYFEQLPAIQGRRLEVAFPKDTDDDFVSIFTSMAERKTEL